MNRSDTLKIEQYHDSRLIILGKINFNEMTIYDIKHMIESKKEVNDNNDPVRVYHQLLFFRGGLLGNNNAKLIDYGISHGKIYPRIRLLHKNDVNVDLFIRMMDNRTIKINFNCQDSSNEIYDSDDAITRSKKRRARSIDTAKVEDLISKIEQITGLSMKDCVLMYQGRHLDSIMTLRQYNIQKRSVLHVLKNSGDLQANMANNMANMMGHGMNMNGNIENFNNNGNGKNGQNMDGLMTNDGDCTKMEQSWFDLKRNCLVIDLKYYDKDFVFDNEKDENINESKSYDDINGNYDENDDYYQYEEKKTESKLLDISRLQLSKQCDDDVFVNSGNNSNINISGDGGNGGNIGGSRCPMVGILLYLYNEKQEWYLNGIYCETGDIILKSIKGNVNYHLLEINKLQNMAHKLYESVFKQAIGFNNDELVAIGFVVNSNGKITKNLGVLRPNSTIVKLNFQGNKKQASKISNYESKTNRNGDIDEKTAKNVKQSKSKHKRRNDPSVIQLVSQNELTCVEMAIENWFKNSNGMMNIKNVIFNLLQPQANEYCFRHWSERIEQSDKMAYKFSLD